MWINSLHLSNFRNYKESKVNFHSNFNLICGSNAQGKTNLLEAVSFLASGDSFRVREEEEVIRWGTSYSRLNGRVDGNIGEIKLQIELFSNESKKKLIVNGVNKTNKANYSGIFTTVLFTPDDLEIVKGSPAIRRNFIDNEISKASPSYARELIRYKRVLRQRNYLLKEHGKKAIHSGEMNGWDEQLAIMGARIIRKRFSDIHRLSLLARLVHRKLTERKEQLSISYRTELAVDGKTSEEEVVSILLAKLKEKAEREAVLGQTLSGPHRDDLALQIDGREARLFASQGQQRTLILALKLAELEYIKGETGDFPVLLFDDVFSELDEKRGRLLVETIDGRAQAIVTSTEVRETRIFEEKGRMIFINGGEVEESASSSRSSEKNFGGNA